MLNDRGVCVLDFGIAKVLATSTDATKRMRRPNRPDHRHSALYVAQQCLGQGIGPASDLYSVGVLIYEMLVGHPPFMDQLPSAVLSNRQPRRHRHFLHNAQKCRARSRSSCMRSSPRIRPSARRRQPAHASFSKKASRARRGRRQHCPSRLSLRLSRRLTLQAAAEPFAP